MAPASVEFHPLVSARCPRYGTSWSKRNNTRAAESNERPLPWDVRAPIEHKRTGKRLNKGSVIDELVSPVLFRWHGASEHHGVGCCTNVGLGGIFVIASECPATGTQVCLEVLIRAFDPVGGSRLKCSGHVVRIQASDQVSGFAVAGRFGHWPENF